MVGEPSRALPDVDFALGGRDFQGDTGARAADRRRPVQRLRRARSRRRGSTSASRAARTRRVYASSSCRPFELASCGRRDRLEPVRRDRALVRARLASCSSSTTPTRRSTPTATCSTIPAQAEEMGRRARERVLDEHTYRHRARQLLELVGLRRRASVRVALTARAASRSSPRSTRSATIGGVIDELRAFDPELDVVVVDDGSLDATADVARASTARTSCTLPFNLGIGGAVQTGFRYAREHGYDLAVRVDGDGQHDPAELRAAARRRSLAGEADICVGSRFAGADGYRSSRDAARRHPHPRAAPSRCSRGSASPTRRRGFQVAEPQGDRAVRRRLPARLPRGRGGGDGCTSTGCASPRCRCGCASAPRGRSSIRGAPVGLLHGEGDARDLRRRASGGGRRRWRTHDPRRRRRRCKVSIAATAASLLLAARRLRADPLAPAARALRAALAADRRSCCSCSRPGAAG